MSAPEQRLPADHFDPSTSEQVVSGDAAESVYRKLLEQYVEIYDKGSWSLTLGALAVSGYLVTNLDRVKALAGTGNTFVTLISIAFIALIGLLLKGIHNRIAAVVKFKVPTVRTGEEMKAFRAFERYFKLDGEILLEKFFPDRAAANRRAASEDIHERWKVWLWLVWLSSHLSFIRNLAILVTVCSFAYGTIGAVNGHDRSISEMKKEMNERVAAMNASMAELQQSYKNVTGGYQKEVAAMRDVVSSTKAELAGTQKQLENRQDVIKIQQGRIENLENVLTNILTFQKQAWEKEGSPAAIAAAKKLDEVIKAFAVKEPDVSRQEVPKK